MHKCNLWHFKQYFSLQLPAHMNTKMVLIMFLITTTMYHTFLMSRMFSWALRLGSLTVGKDILYLKAKYLDFSVRMMEPGVDNLHIVVMEWIKIFGDSSESPKWFNTAMPKCLNLFWWIFWHFLVKLQKDHA